MRLSFTFLLGFFCQLLIAQEYFQQEVNYNIGVVLNDSLHSLHAFEEIEYINNSPRSLDSLVFHLWPNAYCSNNTELGKQIREGSGKGRYLDNPTQSGHIDSLDFKVNGERINWRLDPEHIDICILHLNQPIQPGEAVQITTPFYVKLPSGSMSRLGHFNQSYLITQWFPKPAVFDHKGWHPMSYLDIGEFYSEFGSFEVSITLPANYWVAGTGNLMNEDEKLKLIQKAQETFELDSYPIRRDYPKSFKALKTLTFKEENIHDFAWFADKRFNILKGEVELPYSGRKVNTWAYFPNHQAELWDKSIEYLNDAIYYYSLWYGEYPYNNCTAVHSPGSRGGMEYPTVTVISNNETDMSLELVVMHEVGHNWFQGILGSNERDHPWMDEGINTFSEMRYFNSKYPQSELYKMQMKSETSARIMGLDNFRYPYLHQLLYRLMARRNLDVPLNSSSEDLFMMNYSPMAYSKTGLCFYYLKEYLGEATFNRIMREYFDTWKFKHPYPEDLRKIIEDNTDEDLSWFFDDLLSSTKKLDYGISKVKKDKILIRNHGQIQSPVLISEMGSDSLITEQWVKGFEGKQWVQLQNPGETRSVNLFGSVYPDIQTTNDRASGKGILKISDPMELRLLGVVDRPGQAAINILPAIAKNFHNGFMLGGLIYSDIIPLPKFEYQILPMYAFGNDELAGMGKLQYHIHPYSDLFQRISIFTTARQFGFANKSNGYYQKLSGGLNFRFKRRDINKPIDNDVKLEYIYASDLTKLGNGEFMNYYRARYDHSNKRRVDPYSLTIESHGNEMFLKGSVDFEYRHIYIYENSLDIRVFAGTFINRDVNLSPVYNFNSSGTTGLNDYLYDELYFARFEDPIGGLFAAHQFSPEGGGFATYSPFGNSSKYLLSVNLASSLPIKKKIPIQFYVNASIFGENNNGFNLDEPFHYEGGVKLRLVKDVVEIYFPLVHNPEVETYLPLSYFDRIRFTFQLNKLNIFDLAREM